jgi:ABC-2 type transport system permease protein
LPAVMLSGYVFPIEHMPREAQWLAALNPMTYYIELVRGLMVRGSPIAEMTEAVLKLAAIGTIVFVIAILRFKKRAA